jgi:hypothetical protein
MQAIIVTHNDRHYGGHVDAKRLFFRMLERDVLLHDVPARVYTDRRCSARGTLRAFLGDADNSRGECRAHSLDEWRMALQKYREFKESQGLVWDPENLDAEIDIELVLDIEWRDPAVSDEELCVSGLSGKSFLKRTL